MTYSPASLRPRVLLVEDDDGVRRATHLLLHGRGYDVRSHSAAGPLLADPEAARADFLVADYRLPDGDGIALLKALQEKGWTGRAVLVTGHAVPGLDERARESGFAMLLEKPLRQHELIGALTTLQG